MSLAHSQKFAATNTQRGFLSFDAATGASPKLDRNVTETSTFS